MRDFDLSFDNVKDQGAVFTIVTMLGLEMRWRLDHG